MSRPIISVRNLSKKYRLGTIGATTLKEELEQLWASFRRNGNSDPQSAIRNSKSESFWALRDVSFEVQRGEIVGIVGRNGAGKSTLLKILSRITKQTTGEITLRGRVASLLEVGTGFHPDLTGRENIFLNGAILGMKKDEIAHKFDEIVNFAEIHKFIDTPVKRYSSGMYVRLAFAVAAHLEPEILLVDEVLAVGDVFFQRKCIGKMEEDAYKGRTVLFVSHNLKAVEALCTRAILLDEGAVVAEGTPVEVIAAYNKKLQGEVAPGQSDFKFPSDPSKSGEITRIRIANQEGQSTSRYGVFDPIDIEVDFILRRDFPTLILTAHVWTNDGVLALATVDSDWENFSSGTMRDHFPRQAGRYQASFRIPAPLLNCKVYEIEMVLTLGPVRVDTQRGIFFDVEDSGSYLSYVSKSNRGGVLSVPIPWQVRRTDELLSVPDLDHQYELPVKD